MNVHEYNLREASKQIRAQGINGWGNACDWAADEIKRLSERCMELELFISRQKYASTSSEKPK